MKKYLTLRNVIMGSAIFIALLFFFLSFAINASGIANLGDQMKVTFKGIVWGTSSIVGTKISTGETNTESIYEMFGFSSSGLNLPVFFGVLLPLLAAVALAFCFFAVKNKKHFQYIGLVLALVFITGGILQFFAISGLKDAFVRQFVTYQEMTKEQAKIAVETMIGGYNLGLSALSIISGIFAILAGLGVGFAQVVEDKQLVK